MKLRVVVNTHKRPAQALAVIECLRALSSGRHEVSYVLAYDVEDEETVQFVADAFCYLQDVGLDMRPRPASVQDCWNRNFTDPSLPDFWLVMPDDAFCAAPSWDSLIVQTAAGAPVPRLAVMSWWDMANPDMFTLPIVARGWLEAIAPEPLLDPRFPFWFSDTAISETWSYVFGRTPPWPKYLLMASKPQQPNPMLARDGADHLWDLFAETRKDRLATAARIRFDHCIKNPHVETLRRQWEARDVTGRRDTRVIVERMRGEAK